MVQPGFGELDTPRTNVGDATFMSRQPDFGDITQEPSFQSPTKDGNLFAQLRNGRRGVSLRTPRGVAGRAPFMDRNNLPQSLGGAEFTPMLKSATRNGSRGGKENGLPGLNTPALGKIDEDLTPIPSGETSIYQGSRSASMSYVERTPAVQVPSSSVSSTPLVLPSRRPGILQDGNQLSLREQESIIDKIEKENFSLKLKIHFLEEALRKAGPGIPEATVKENTELKIDKVTLQRELSRYKKHLTATERELESYRQQLVELQEKAKKKYADESQRAEMDKLRQSLAEREAEIDELQRQLEDAARVDGDAEALRDQIVDLEADVRRKDQIISEHEEQLEDAKERLREAEEGAARAEKRMQELEERARSSEELDEAKEAIDELEHSIRRLEMQVEELKEKLEDATSEKERAEADLEELRDEMANKSVVTKGLSRQIEEKANRLQTELDQAREAFDELDRRHQEQLAVAHDLEQKLKEVRQERDASEQERKRLAARLEEAEVELKLRSDEKHLLQGRHDALTAESASLQKDVARLQKSVDELEDSLDQEKAHALQLEDDLRERYKAEIDRLNDDISDLQAELRQKENLLDNESEKWETERHRLESDRDRTEERAAGLQRTIDKLREVEGSLSDKESKLQEALDSEIQRHKSEEAVLQRQIEELQRDLESRHSALTELRSELSGVRDELRQSRLDLDAQVEKAMALEDEIEVLQTSADEESEEIRQELATARKEIEGLRQQVEHLQAGSSRASQKPGAHDTESVDGIRAQLVEKTSQLEKVAKEKQTLQDQIATTNIELHRLRTSLAEVEAERDELDAELRRAKQQDEETFRVDQERIDLRTAKIKLDSEVRRLRDENKLINEQRRSLEKTLEEEIEKAAAEEERLNQEIHQLQARLRSNPAESQDLSAARRTIRDLERKLESVENQLADALARLEEKPQESGNNSELSLLRHDLTAARAREREVAAREASHRETVKALKRQIADLERQVHESEMSRLLGSPGGHEKADLAASTGSSSSSAAHRAEVAGLRNQVSTAQQALNEAKAKLRAAERKAAADAREAQRRVDDLEERCRELEAALAEAQQEAGLEAEERAAAFEREAGRLRQKLEREREKVEKLTAENRKAKDGLMAAVAAANQRQSQGPKGKEKSSSSKHRGHDAMDTVEMSVAERRDLHAMLRKTQVEADALERKLREQTAALEAAAASETSLRRKLDRARNERAAFKASAEKLGRDLRALRAAGVVADADHDRPLVHQTHSGADTDAIVRAAEAADQRHARQVRGLDMQVECFKNLWHREQRLREDAAYAKRFLQLQLEVAHAWYVLSPYITLTLFIYAIVVLDANLVPLQQQSRPAQARRDPAAARHEGDGIAGISCGGRSVFSDVPADAETKASRGPCRRPLRRSRVDRCARLAPQGRDAAPHCCRRRGAHTHRASPEDARAHLEVKSPAAVRA